MERESKRVREREREMEREADKVEKRKIEHWKLRKGSNTAID